LDVRGINRNDRIIKKQKALTDLFLMLNPPLKRYFL
jgi:hypothetical protein